MGGGGGGGRGGGGGGRAREGGECGAGRGGAEAGDGGWQVGGRRSGLPRASIRHGRSKAGHRPRDERTTMNTRLTSNTARPGGRRRPRCSPPPPFSPWGWPSPRPSPPAPHRQPPDSRAGRPVHEQQALEPEHRDHRRQRPHHRDDLTRSRSPTTWSTWCSTSATFPRGSSAVRVRADRQRRWRRKQLRPSRQRGAAPIRGTASHRHQHAHQFQRPHLRLGHRYSGPGGAIVGDYSMNEQPVGTVNVTH